MRILIVALERPCPHLGGAALRTLGLATTAQTLERVSRVRVLSLLSNPEGEATPSSACDETANFEFKSANLHRSLFTRAVRRIASATTGLPHHLQVVTSKAAQDAVLHHAETFSPDIIQFEQLATVRLASSLYRAGCHRPKLLFSAHNLEHRIVRQTPGGPAAKLSVQKVTAKILARLDRRQRGRVQLLEREALSKVDGIIAVTEEEAAWFSRQTEKPVSVVPNGVEMARFNVPQHSSSPGDNTILFCGHLGYPPNQDAAIFLAQSILPRVRKVHPNTRLVLAGRNPSRAVLRLAGSTTAPAVEILSNPPTNAFLQPSRVLVCPLRTGAGSRIKLLEAAAAGLPIVATPFAAQGLALQPERDYIAGTNARELAQGTLRVLGDHDLRSRLTESARTTIEEHHAWNRLGPSIDLAYETLSRGNGQERSTQRSPTD